MKQVIFLSVLFVLATGVAVEWIDDADEKHESAVVLHSAMLEDRILRLESNCAILRTDNVASFDGPTIFVTNERGYGFGISYGHPMWIIPEKKNSERR